ncbi:MAG: PilZ domain-containing protein [Sphingobium sp.]
MLHSAASAEPEKPMQDRLDRQMTVFISAGIHQRGRDGMCRIRNISAAGLAIETNCILVAGEEAILTLVSGRELLCIVRWVRDGRAGMSCTENVSEIVQSEGRTRAVFAGMIEPALPRFYRQAPITIAVDGLIHRCLLDSISISDVLLSGAPQLRQGALLSIEVKRLGFFPASVSISQDDELFARFGPAIPFHLFDRWLACNWA